VSVSVAPQEFSSEDCISPAPYRAVSGPDVASWARNCRVIWYMIAAMSVATVIAYQATDLSFSPANAIGTVCQALVFLAVSAGYRWLRPDPSISFGAKTCAQLALVLPLGCALSYPMATLGYPYCDALLAAADDCMQLDWRAYLHFINDHPTLAVLTGLAYRSMLLQFSVLALVLVAASQIVRFQRYVLASGLALLLTIVIFTFMPAAGTYSFLEIELDEFSNLEPYVTYYQILALDSLRTGNQTLVDDMQGLIAFPSFHTVWAILFAWGFYPIKQLRIGAIMLNLVVIAATPIQGAHYFIDIVGGAAVAGVAIYIATRLTAERAGAQPLDRRDIEPRRGGVADPFPFITAR
jgi:PAP2 superfamily